jgi:hypothetical protein
MTPPSLEKGLGVGSAITYVYIDASPSCCKPRIAPLSIILVDTGRASQGENWAMARLAKEQNKIYTSGAWVKTTHPAQFT